MFRTLGLGHNRCVPVLALLISLLVVQSHPRLSFAQPTSAFDVIAYIKTVDPQHNKLSVSRGTVTYQIDTAHALIHLPALNSAPGETGDLVVGMRVQVDGIDVESGDVRATRVQVLPYIAPRITPTTAAATVLATPAPQSAELHQGEPIKLVGAVEAIDAVNTTVLLKFDSHTRLVYLLVTTLMQDSDGSDLDFSGIHTGDMLRVAGTVGDDGTVNALSLIKISQAAVPPPAPPPTPTSPPVEQTIIGTVSEEASLFSRDIKVTTPTGDMKIDVPRGIPIDVDGEPCSVHDLKKDMEIQVQGMADANGIQADMITASTTGGLGY
jgi:hypothetical protein